MLLGQYLHFLVLIFLFTLGKLDLGAVVDIQAFPEAKVCFDVSGYIFGMFSHIEQGIWISEASIEYVGLKVALVNRGLELRDANLYVAAWWRGNDSRQAREIRLTRINW